MYYFLTALGYVVSLLPASLLNAFAFLLAFLLFDLFRFRRSLVVRNVTRAMGLPESSSEIVVIGRDSVHSLILTALEFIESTRRDLNENTVIENGRYVAEALAEGNGCYVLCIHGGNWEALAGAFCRQFGESYVPVKEVGGESVNRFVSGLRRKYGLYTAKRAKKGDSYKIIEQMIRAGKIVGFMQDQARPGSPKMDFFGHPCKTNVSMAAIWRKLPAPIVPAVSHRLAPRQHKIEIFPPLKMVASDNAEADLLINAATMNRMVEKMVRANPSQYLWLHDRWKS